MDSIALRGQNRLFQRSIIKCKSCIGIQVRKRINNKILYTINNHFFYLFSSVCRYIGENEDSIYWIKGIHLKSKKSQRFVLTNIFRNWILLTECNFHSLGCQYPLMKSKLLRIVLLFKTLIICIPNNNEMKREAKEKYQLNYNR